MPVSIGGIQLYAVVAGTHHMSVKTLYPESLRPTRHTAGLIPLARLRGRGKNAVHIAIKLCTSQ